MLCSPWIHLEAASENALQPHLRCSTVVSWTGSEIGPILHCTRYEFICHCCFQFNSQRIFRSKKRFPLHLSIVCGFSYNFCSNVVNLIEHDPFFCIHSFVWKWDKIGSKDVFLIFAVKVGSELTTTLDMDRNDYEPPFSLPIVCDLIPTPPTYRHAVINTLVHVHKSVQKLNEQVRLL